MKKVKLKVRNNLFTIIFDQLNYQNKRKKKLMEENEKVNCAIWFKYPLNLNFF